MATERVVVWMGAGYYRPRVYSAIALVLWTWTPDEPFAGTWVDSVKAAGRIGRVIGEGAQRDGERISTGHGE